MSYKKPNRVRMSITGTPGTGDVALNVATSGYQTLLNGGLVNGDTFPYVIEDGSAWEVGVGTYNSGVPSFTRTTVRASSAGGTTKISATSSAIIYSAIQGEDVVVSATTIAALTGDVLIASPADTEVLTYENSSSKWKNKPAPTGPTTVAALTGDVLISAPANNDVLTYETSSTKWKNKPAAGGGGGGPGGTMTPPTVAGLAAVTNLGSATLTDRTTGLLMPCMHIAPGAGSGDGILSCALKVAPVGNMSVVTRIRDTHYDRAGGWHSAGPVMHNSAGTISFYHMRVTGYNIQIYKAKWSGNFSPYSTFTLGGGPMQGDWFQHLDYDGTNVKMGISRNGKDIVWFDSETLVSFLGAITHVGIGWSGASDSTHGPEWDVEHFYAGALGTNGL